MCPSARHPIPQSLCLSLWKGETGHLSYCKVEAIHGGEGPNITAACLGATGSPMKVNLCQQLRLGSTMTRILCSQWDPCATLSSPPCGGLQEVEVYSEGGKAMNCGTW